MNTRRAPTQGGHGVPSVSSPSGDLTIGDLAQRTGLATATIRMWESRHGFPRPGRLESGHRRYDESDVTALAHVVRRRDAGVRLDAAIAEALVAQRPDSPSVFAELRRRHPHLVVQRLRKPTLLALSWAIEDECAARAVRAHVFGAFQHERRYEAARARWEELARLAESTYVFAEFRGGTSVEPGAGSTPVRVPLVADAPMRREWAVVCDCAEMPVALTAWELPGQAGVAQHERVFEALWTIDPVGVRDAARVCARIAVDSGAPGAGPLSETLAAEPVRGSTDPATITSLFNRMVGYVDRIGAS